MTTDQVAIPLRNVDELARSKDVDREDILTALEKALETGARRKYGLDEELEFEITIDRVTGGIVYPEDLFTLDLADFGRIFAQTVKQVLNQGIREVTRDQQFDEFIELVDSIVTGQVQRFEGDNLYVNMGKLEGFLPREERIRGDQYHQGERVRALVKEVEKIGTRLRVTLSRSDPLFVQRLFEVEVPEITDGVIEIRRVVRESGYRTKVAVHSSDPKIDCIGACVGVRGTRIKSIIDELGGERIDIIRWSDALEDLVKNSLKPADINLDNVFPDEDTNTVIVFVEEDQQSLAIGKRGQNVRLASKLCGWEIEIKTRQEFEAEEMAKVRIAELQAAGEEVPEDLLAIAQGRLRPWKVREAEEAAAAEAAAASAAAAEAEVAEADAPADDAEPEAAEEPVASFTDVDEETEAPAAASEEE